MRINLTTPFAEKDAAKALGARWDSAKKTWYISDVADLTPFLRWIAHPAAATEKPTGVKTQPAIDAASAPAREPRAIVTRSTIEVPHCGCDVLPWEDCVHTALS